MAVSTLGDTISIAGNQLLLILGRPVRSLAGVFAKEPSVILHSADMDGVSPSTFIARLGVRVITIR